MPADPLDTKSFWLVEIISVNMAKTNIQEDYNHLIGREQEYLQCCYFEKEHETRKGYVYKKDDKTAYIYKESVIYPFVTSIKNKQNQYILANQEYCEILAYVEETGYSHL